MNREGWSGRGDLNARPPAPKAGALPGCATPRQDIPILPRSSPMKKPDIAKRIAKQSRVTEAEAADRLDRMVHHILSNLRKGKETPLPGLGALTLGRDGKP